MNITSNEFRRNSFFSNAIIYGITALFMTMLPASLLGHGVKVNVSLEKPFVVVGAAYHAGKALTDAAVTVLFKSTDKKNIKFQEGKTDRNGRFSFSPDKPGVWMVMVDDLTGHRGKKNITLTGDFFKKPEPTAADTPKDAPKDAVESKEKPESLPEKQDGSEQSKSPFSSTQWCCYMLKILLGVALILVITFVMHRLTKPKG